MSEPICLTVEEVAEVTGAHWRRTQMRWFASHGIPAELGADGRDWRLLGHLDQRTFERVYNRMPRKVTPAR